MNVFLDCGTNFCQGLKSHINKYNIDHTWIIHSFEANPFTYVHAKNIIARHFSHLNITLHNNAVWVESGSKPLTVEYQSEIGVRQLLKDNGFDASCVDLDADNALWVGGASNTMGEQFKVTPEMDKLKHLDVRAKSIDFIKFIEHLGKVNIYIKMDIEGSEYEVLSKLLASPAIKNIKEITIEWHNRLLTKSYDQKYIMDALLSKGVRLHSKSINDKIDEIESRVRSAPLIMPHISDYHYAYWERVVPLITVNGLWCEFGVYRGRSIQRIAKLSDHIIYGFDSFEGLPEDWDSENPKGCYGSGGVIPNGAIVGNNHSMFDSSPTANTEPWHHTIYLIKGYFQDTLPPFVKEHHEDAAFLHIDSDLYSSCNTILFNFRHKIVNGTILCFDDFMDFAAYRDGEIKSLAEFLLANDLDYEPLIHHGVGAHYSQACIRIIK
jgi:FkbM family methyltransferase